MDTQVVAENNINNMETQVIGDNQELVQNTIHDLIALHGVDDHGNIIADVDGVRVQENSEYQVVTQEYQEQEYQEEGQEYQQEGEQETQVYQVQEGEEYQEQETQEYHVQVQDGQVYQDAETQEYHEYQEGGQEYQEQETQEYHPDQEGQQEGEEYQQQETQVYVEQEYQEQEYQNEHEGGEYQVQQGEEMMEEGGENQTQIVDENSELVQNAIHDLIQFHGVDADGNIITTTVDGSQVASVDQNNVEMIGDEETDQNFTENTEESNQQQDNIQFHLANDTNATESSTFLNIQEAIFNPNTGTLEPMTSAPRNTSTSTPTTSRLGGRTARRSPAVKQPKRGKVQNQQVKFVIPGEAGQQIILDARALQGLLQGGGNRITLSGASGKQQNILIAPASPHRGRVATTSSRSPAKILPAPVPVGDQQQPSSGTNTRFMLKQGNVYTPISTAMGQSLGGGAKFIQMQGSGGGNQIQYVRLVNKQTSSNKIPIAPSRPKPVAPRPTGGQTIFSLPSSGSSGDMNSMQGSGLGNFVVLPSSYVQVKSEPNTPVPIRPAEMSSSSSSSYNGILESSASILGGFSQSMNSQSSGNFESFRSLLEPNGMRPRKPCNCTKSQCLKLYCDCFANGEFCHLCNCNNCYNNLNHEEDRQKAIKLVLERNPGAFRPKIGKSSQTGEAHERRHNKGCNCRRSGCLKNYCECYEAKIFCSGICKCSGCKNCIENIPSGLPNDVGVEQHFAGAGTSHRQTLKDLAEAAEVRVQQQTQVRNKMKAQMQDVSPQNNLGNMVPPVIFRYPHGSISYEVVTSIVELLLAKTETGEKHKIHDGDLEKVVLEEFGECLSSVMELGTTIGHLDD